MISVFRAVLSGRYIALFLWRISPAPCSHNASLHSGRQSLSKAIPILNTQASLNCASQIKFIKAEAGSSWAFFITVAAIMTLLSKGVNGFTLLLEVHSSSEWCVTFWMASLHLISVVIPLTYSVWSASLSFPLEDSNDSEITVLIAFNLLWNINKQLFSSTSLV